MVFGDRLDISPTLITVLFPVLHSRGKRPKKEDIIYEAFFLRGEIYYADLSPIVGSEQGGTRPVLIIQNNVGNRFASTVIVAAITSRINAKPKQPTHSFIGTVGTMKYPSVVMLEQLRTLDKCRVGPYVGSLSDEKMEDVTRALCISLAINRQAVKGV